MKIGPVEKYLISQSSNHKINWITSNFTYLFIKVQLENFLSIERRSCEKAIALLNAILKESSSKRMKRFRNKEADVLNDFKAIRKEWEFHLRGVHKSMKNGHVKSPSEKSEKTDLVRQMLTNRMHLSYRKLQKDCKEYITSLNGIFHAYYNYKIRQSSNDEVVKYF